MFTEIKLERVEFIPTPLVTNKNVKKIGVDFLVTDYVATAGEVNDVEETPVPNEMEPSTANIVDNKLGTVGNDFKSFDPRVLRGE